jgi:hypothetical protein
MKASFKPILIALLFAGLLILSSYVLKGTKIGDWVDAAIYLAGAYLLFQYFGKLQKSCSTKSER